jgi:hypothetical protein
MSQGYAALLEPEPEGGFTVTFPDIGTARATAPRGKRRCGKPRTCLRKQSSV